MRDGERPSQNIAGVRSAMYTPISEPSAITRFARHVRAFVDWDLNLRRGSMAITLLRKIKGRGELPKGGAIYIEEGGLSRK